MQSKKISNDQELIQSDPTSCPQNQKFTKYVTNIIAEPKNKYGQQITTTEVPPWNGQYKNTGGLNRFYRIPTSPSASIMAQNIQLFGPREGFLTHQWIITFLKSPTISKSNMIGLFKLSFLQANYCRIIII